MSTGIGLLMIALLTWFWVDSLRAREAALDRVASLCREMDIQLLDQTVRLGRLRPGRDRSGRMRFRRFYVFEYSLNGADRWHGVAIVLARFVEYVHIEHPDGPIVMDSRPEVDRVDHPESTR
ncbi:MAG: DUF3301 domain-containing protein [Pseudomonadota bacterium]|nr:DUF3301 domain-containing protein [Pseudomonadota bacterium]